MSTKYGNPRRGPMLARRILLTVAMTVAAGGVGAATIKVDGVKCTLFAAIKAANTDSAVGLCPKGSLADTLKLSPRTHSVTTVAHAGGSYGDTGLPPVTSVITIDGGRKGAIIERAQGASNFRLLRVEEDGELTLNRISVRNGHSSGNGGGIYSLGKLRLTSSTVKGNSSDANGGGISVSSGTLTVINSTVTGNIAENWGGGIALGSAAITLTNSTVSDNRAENGSGLSVGISSSALIENSVISDNIADEYGGGFYVDDSTLTFTNSTLAGNRSLERGGGFYSDGGAIITLTNSTVSGNRADGDSGYGGGGYFRDGDARLIHVTFSRNHATISGGGLRVYGLGLTLTNSIIADSSSGGDCLSASPDLTAHTGRNLIEDGSCEVLNYGGLAGDPKLGLLADNGGATPSHALATTSPAKNAAISSLCRANDQRGVDRPQGTRCDLGAVELVLSPHTTVQPVVDYFDSAVRSRTLVGTNGRRVSVRTSRRDALRHQLLTAGDLIAQGLPVRKGPCPQLRKTLSRIDTDGSPDKNDYVTGAAGSELAEMIRGLRTDLGCN